MKLSVVMPVYNERNTLREVVERVLAVALDLELVCVDDGSQDGSREILAAKSGVGPFPLDWVAEFPDLVWQMPAGVRAWLNARCLRAAATG